MHIRYFFPVAHNISCLLQWKYWEEVELDFVEKTDSAYYAASLGPCLPQTK